MGEKSWPRKQREMISLKFFTRRARVRSTWILQIFHFIRVVHSFIPAMECLINAFVLGLEQSIDGVVFLLSMVGDTIKCPRSTDYKVQKG